MDERIGPPTDIFSSYLRSIIADKEEEESSTMNSYWLNETGGRIYVIEILFLAVVIQKNALIGTRKW